MWIFYVFSVPLCASFYICLVVTCWERADLLAIVCGVLLLVCHFPIGILGQVWYLISSSNYREVDINVYNPQNDYYHFFTYRTYALCV